MLLGLAIIHVTSFTEDLRLHHTSSFFLIAIFFHCRLSDVNLGRLVRGDAYDCLVSPTACAVLELLEDLGESFCPNYSINSNVTKILMLSVLVLTKTNIISSSFISD